VGSKQGVEPSSVDRGNVVEGGVAHARLAVSLGARLVVPARSTASRVCSGSYAPAPSGVHLVWLKISAVSTLLKRIRLGVYGTT
jgi:hypothetical protein